MFYETLEMKKEARSKLREHLADKLSTNPDVLQFPEAMREEAARVLKGMQISAKAPGKKMTREYVAATETGMGYETAKYLKGLSDAEVEAISKDSEHPLKDAAKALRADGGKEDADFLISYQRMLESEVPPTGRDTDRYLDIESRFDVGDAGLERKADHDLRRNVKTRGKGTDELRREEEAYLRGQFKKNKPIRLYQARTRKRTRAPLSISNQRPPPPAGPAPLDIPTLSTPSSSTGAPSSSTSTPSPSTNESASKKGMSAGTMAALGIGVPAVVYGGYRALRPRKDQRKQEKKTAAFVQMLS